MRRKAGPSQASEVDPNLPPFDAAAAVAELQAAFRAADADRAQNAASANQTASASAGEVTTPSDIPPPTAAQPSKPKPRSTATSSNAASSTATSPSSLTTALVLFTLICALLAAVSYAQTSTFTFGVTASSPSSSSFPLLTAALSTGRQWINHAKICVQTLAGLRPAAVASKLKGYGGVTKIKKKKKKLTGKEQQAALQQQEGGGSGAPWQSGGNSEDDEPLLDIHPPVPRDPHALYLTLEELATFTGADGGSIFLAIYGRIFDVTSGRNFYGQEGSYSSLAAKDGTRAFASGCYDNKGLWDTRGLTKDQRKAIDHWYNFYNNHNVYKPVGWVMLPRIEPDAPMPNDQC